MIPILIAIGIAFFASLYAMRYADKHPSRFPNAVAGFFGLVGFVCTCIAALFYAWFALNWFSAGHRMDIINREYGTSYTHEEVFWASHVIDNVHQRDRKRVEVNGDVMCAREKDFLPGPKQEGKTNE